MTTSTTKRRIACLGVIVVVGVPIGVSGCGVRTSLWGTDPAGGGTATARPTATVTSSPPSTGRPPRDPDDPPPDPEGQCPSTTPIDASNLPYFPPVQSPGACTMADVDALIAFIDKDGDPRNWKSSLSTAACKSCVFGLYSASTWAPILEDGSGNPVALNVGGCMAITTGLAQCGKAYQQWYDCRLEACIDCSDDRDYARCISSADKGACAKAYGNVTPSCGGQGPLTKAESFCYGDHILYGPVVAQCVGAGDGG